jgi:hypothetical protein
MNWDERHRPSWTGGAAVPQRKYCEATTVGTDGVVVQTRTKHLNNHPVRSLSMLRDFLDVAATPPVQEGQCPVPHFIHTFIDRACMGLHFSGEAL